jgi:hypothetical protein
VGVEFFSSLVDEAIRKAGGQRMLAEKLELGLATVSAWRGEGLPRLDSFVKLLDYVGGDIRRALPGWEADAQGKALVEAPLLGRVAAGTARYSAEDGRTIVVSPQDFRRSRWYHCTRAPQSGRAIEWIQVDGASMEPEYPDGCLLACRPPADPANLPSGAHAILRTRAGDMTFKVVQFRGTGRNRELCAVPINRLYEVQFFPLGEVEIDWIVLGMFLHRVNDPTPARTGVLREGGGEPGEQGEVVA